MSTDCTLSDPRDQESRRPTLGLGFNGLNLVDVVSVGDLVRAAHEVVSVVQRVQRRLEGEQVPVAQVVGVRQAPLPPAVRVAPAVALPAEAVQNLSDHCTAGAANTYRGKA